MVRCGVGCGVEVAEVCAVRSLDILPMSVNFGPIFSSGFPSVSSFTVENSTKALAINGAEKCSSPPTKQEVYMYIIGVLRES